METNGTAQPKYEIVSIHELNELEAARRSQVQAMYIVDYNGAFVTIFKDGSAMIRPPAAAEDEGLLFSNAVDMNKMIAAGVFPVKAIDSFWVTEKPRVLHFADSMPYYCTELSKMLDHKVEFNSDSTYLKELSAASTRVLQSKTKKKDLLRNYLAIYIGELLRRKVNGEWKLFPHKALNVFYIPEITKGNTFCTHWSFVVKRLGMAARIPVDIESLVEASNRFYPGSGRQYLKAQ